MNSQNLNQQILCIKQHNYNVGQHQTKKYTNAFLIPTSNQLLNEIANPTPNTDANILYNKSDDLIQNQDKIVEQAETKEEEVNEQVNEEWLRETGRDTSRVTGSDLDPRAKRIKKGRPPGSKNNKKKNLRSAEIGAEGKAEVLGQVVLKSKSGTEPEHISNPKINMKGKPGSFGKLDALIGKGMYYGAKKAPPSDKINLGDLIKYSTGAHRFEMDLGIDTTGKDKGKGKKHRGKDKGKKSGEL